MTRATLDFDASLFPSSGRDAHMSYKGESGYMPMMAFWAETGLVAHDDFRYGNASPGGDALAFFKETLEQLPAQVQEVRVRSDSAWYQAQVLDYCAEHGHAFCIGADQDEAVKQLFVGRPQADWQPVHVAPDAADGEDYVREWACESVHALNGSKRAYRMVLLRKERRQDDLFEGAYAYAAIITNMDLPLEEQVAFYRARANCENRIKKLKWDFELRVLPSGDFFVNAVYMRLMTLAYTLLVALKTLVRPASFGRLRLKALLFRLLGLPALVVKHAGYLWLKLPRGHPHLALFGTVSG